MGEEGPDRKASNQTLHRVGDHYWQMFRVLHAGRDANPDLYDQYLSMARNHRSEILALEKSEDKHNRWVFSMFKEDLIKLKLVRKPFTLKLPGRLGKPRSKR